MFFINCGFFVLIVVVFVLFLLSLRFGQISPLAFFRWFTATSDRNAESCNRIPSNSCLPELFFIAPRFWPSKPLAGLGRIWNRYLLTMPTWNRRDSTTLSAAPRAPKEGSNYWGYGYKTQHSYPRSRLITWRRPEVKFGRNVVKEETTLKLPRWGQKVRNK